MWYGVWFVSDHPQVVLYQMIWSTYCLILTTWSLQWWQRWWWWDGCITNDYRYKKNEGNLTRVWMTSGTRGNAHTLELDLELEAAFTKMLFFRSYDISHWWSFWYYTYMHNDGRRRDLLIWGCYSPQWFIVGYVAWTLQFLSCQNLSYLHKEILFLVYFLELKSVKVLCSVIFMPPCPHPCNIGCRHLDFRIERGRYLVDCMDQNFPSIKFIHSWCSLQSFYFECKFLRYH